MPLRLLLLTLSAPRTALERLVRRGACFGTATYAQHDLGRIEGIVVDRTGTVVPGTAVTLWSDEGNEQKLSETQSDGAGQFAFPDLVAGRYEVRAEFGGSQMAATSVALRAGQAAMLRMVLELGSISETEPILRTEIARGTELVYLAQTAASLSSEQALSA